MSVTIDQLKTRIPEISGYGDVLLSDALAEAIRRTSQRAWGARADDATTYLAAHLATILKSGSATAVGPVVSETVGSISRTYASVTGAASNLASSAWGRMYHDLLRTVFVPRVV